MYIDDAIVFFETDLVKSPEEVLKRFEDSELKLKAQKYSFVKTQGKSLQHKVSAVGRSPDMDTVKSIHNHREPSNVGELKSFLGLMSYYRKFIQMYVLRFSKFYALI